MRERRREKDAGRFARRTREAQAWARAKIRGETNDPAPTNRVATDFLASNYPELIFWPLTMGNSNQQVGAAIGERVQPQYHTGQDTSAFRDLRTQQARPRSEFLHPNIGRIGPNHSFANQVSTVERINHGCVICYRHYTYDRIHDDIITTCCDMEVGRCCLVQAFQSARKCCFCGHPNPQVRNPLPNRSWGIITDDTFIDQRSQAIDPID